MKLGTEELKVALTKIGADCVGRYKSLAVKLLLSKNELYTTDPELLGLTKMDIMKIGHMIKSLEIELEIED